MYCEHRNMFMNKYEARTQDQIIYERNDNSTNPPSKERYGPHESQHRQAVDKSKNVAFININGKRHRKYSQPVCLFRFISSKKICPIIA